MLVLSLGYGVGAGIISEGRLLRGAINSTGEWWHTTVNFEGPACRTATPVWHYPGGIVVRYA
jgi:predicted NBD/HSP70 family sugar kinase